jgi:hypothetical protein
VPALLVIGSDIWFDFSYNAKLIETRRRRGPPSRYRRRTLVPRERKQARSSFFVSTRIQSPRALCPPIQITRCSGTITGSRATKPAQYIRSIDLAARTPLQFQAVLLEEILNWMSSCGRTSGGTIFEKSQVLPGFDTSLKEDFT